MRHLKLAVGVAFVLALVAYANSLYGDFVFDDDSLIRENPLVTEPGRLTEILWSPGQGPTYRAVRTLSYAIDYRLWGGVPVGYHLSNVLYHGLAAVLVFAICQLAGLELWVSSLALIAFVLHPVHTDAVTYISGRRDVLSSVFWLAGFACFLADRRRPSPAWLAGFAACFLLAIFTKEMAVSLPFVCLAYQLTWGRTRPDDHARGPILHVLMLVAAAIYAFYAVKVQHGATIRAVPHGGSYWITLLTMSRAFWHYAWLLLYPVHLLADYSVDSFPLSTGLADPATAVALAAVLAAGLAPFLLARSHPRLAFGLFWHWLTLGPVAQIIPHSEMMAEHYLYLPSVAFCVGAAVLAGALRAIHPRAALAVVLAVSLAYGVRTVQRNEVWQDSYTLWGTTVRDAPRCARAHNNFALALEGQGRLPDADREYRAALAITPDDPCVLNNHGALLVQLGQVPQARRELQAAVDRMPGYPEAQNNLGAVLREQGELAAAERHLRQAIALRPGYRSARSNLALTLRRAGPAHYPEAEQIDRALLAEGPDTSVLNNLGALYLDWNRPADALEAFRRALKESPDSGALHLNMARAHLALGHAPAAEEELLRAAVSDEGPGFTVDCARLALKLGQRDVAARLYQRVRGQVPADPDLEKL